MTQDYWGSAAGVVIEHRCGPGAGACNEHCPDRWEGREREQKTNQNMSPSTGSASEAQGPWQCWPRFFSSDCLFLYLLFKIYDSSIWVLLHCILRDTNRSYASECNIIFHVEVSLHNILNSIQCFIMFSFTFHLFLFKNILCHLPCLMYLLK